MREFPVLDSYEIPYLVSVAKDALEAKLKGSGDEEAITAEDVGIWVHEALLNVNICMETAWRVSVSARDYVRNTQIPSAQDVLDQISSGSKANTVGQIFNSAFDYLSRIVDDGGQLRFSAYLRASRAFEVSELYRASQ